MVYVRLCFSLARSLSLGVILLLSLLACSSQQPVRKNFIEPEQIEVVGKWIMHPDNSFVINPQTSGLTFMGERLYTISDASADTSLRKKLHELNTTTGTLLKDSVINNNLAIEQRFDDGCFNAYLESRPDYEALVALPSKDNQPPQWLLVTEDGSRGQAIVGRCLSAFENKSNFTRYPALLVRVTLLGEQLTITGIRALRFEAGMGTDKEALVEKLRERNNGRWSDKSIANSQENDGIEGLTITRDGRLLFALEEDGNELPRVFELSYSDDLFKQVDTRTTPASFLTLRDSDLQLPVVAPNSSPINGIDIYYPSETGQGFLIAAARNTDRLWIVDLETKQTIKILDVSFYTPPADCNDGQANKMKRVAIEGVAVKGKSLFLVNDPWTEKYKENQGCEIDKEGYEANAALLFELPIDDAWFTVN